MMRKCTGAWLITIVCASCDPHWTPLGAWNGAQAFEAEAGELTGFRECTDAAASQARCIAPPDEVTVDDTPGAARARYTFTIQRTDSYRIWARLRAPDAVHNRFWFQMDDDDWRKWRLSTGEAWFWDALHDDAQYDQPLDFELAAGEHTLSFANAVAGVQLDRIFLAFTDSETATPLPVDDTPCHPPHSIEVAGECVPSCGSLGGNACGEAACRGLPLLVAYDCDVCCERP